MSHYSLYKVRRALWWPIKILTLVNLKKWSIIDFSEMNNSRRGLASLPLHIPLIFLFSSLLELLGEGSGVTSERRTAKKQGLMLGRERESRQSTSYISSCPLASPQPPTRTHTHTHTLQPLPNSPNPLSSSHFHFCGVPLLAIHLG